jgi:hypothetical protein
LPRLQENYKVCGIDHIVFTHAESLQLSGIDPLAERRSRHVEDGHNF